MSWQLCISKCFTIGQIGPLEQIRGKQVWYFERPELMSVLYLWMWTFCLVKQSCAKYSSCRNCQFLAAFPIENLREHKLQNFIFFTFLQCTFYGVEEWSLFGSLSFFFACRWKYNILSNASLPLVFVLLRILLLKAEKLAQFWSFLNSTYHGTWWHRDA